MTRFRLALGLILAALAMEAPAQRLALPVRGVNVHTASGPEMNEVVRMKLNWVRIDVNWADVEAVRGVYDWQGSWLEPAIDAAVSRGLSIYANIGTTPAWACRAGSTGQNCVPKDPADWEKFVRAFATRYRGLIGIHGIWNEPNVGVFWQGDALEYVTTILEPAARAIREVDIDAKIAAPDLSATDSPRIGPKAFLDAIANRKATDLVDFVSWHVYEEGGGGLCGSFNGPGGIYKRFFEGGFCDRSQVYWIDRSTLKDRPILITETGFASGGADPASVTSLYDVFLPNGRVEGLFFYELMDNSGTRLGLVRADGTRKPGGDALARRDLPPGEAPLPLMKESFDRAWMPTLYRWTVSSSAYRIRALALENSQKEFRATVKDVVSGDMEITATIQMTSDLKWPWNWVGVMARTQNPGHGFRETGYLAFLRANGGLGLFRAPDTVLAYVETGINPKERPVRITLRADRDFLKVLIDGEEVLSAQDGTYTTGYCGVQHYSLARTQEVIVTELR